MSQSNEPGDDQNPNESGNDFDFYFQFTKPLVLYLPTAEDRATAAAWVQKLEAEPSTEEERRLRLDYLKLLLFVLQRGRLSGIFRKSPPSGPLQPFPQGFNMTDMGNLMMDQDDIHGSGGGDGRSASYTIEISNDLREFIAAQEIPNFGVQMYYAWSPDESIHKWNLFDEEKFPQYVLDKIKLLKEIQTEEKSGSKTGGKTICDIPLGDKYTKTKVKSPQEIEKSQGRSYQTYIGIMGRTGNGFKDCPENTDRFCRPDQNKPDCRKRQQRRSPQGGSQNCAPQNCPPQNCPPQNCPPQNCPPQNCPPQNYSPQQSCPPQNCPPQQSCPPQQNYSAMQSCSPPPQQQQNCQPNMYRGDTCDGGMDEDYDNFLSGCQQPRNYFSSQQCYDDCDTQMKGMPDLDDCGMGLSKGKADPARSWATPMTKFKGKGMNGGYNGNQSCYDNMMGDDMQSDSCSPQRRSPSPGARSCGPSRNDMFSGKGGSCGKQQQQYWGNGSGAGASRCPPQDKYFDQCQQQPMRGQDDGCYYEDEQPSCDDRRKPRMDCMDDDAIDFCNGSRRQPSPGNCRPPQANYSQNCGPSYPPQSQCKGRMKPEQQDCRKQEQECPNYDYCTEDDSPPNSCYGAGSSLGRPPSVAFNQSWKQTPMKSMNFDYDFDYCQGNRSNGADPCAKMNNQCPPSQPPCPPSQPPCPPSQPPCPPSQPPCPPSQPPCPPNRFSPNQMQCPPSPPPCPPSQPPCPPSQPPCPPSQPPCPPSQPPCPPSRQKMQSQTAMYGQKNGGYMNEMNNMLMNIKQKTEAHRERCGGPRDEGSCPPRAQPRPQSYSPQQSQPKSGAEGMGNNCYGRGGNMQQSSCNSRKSRRSPPPQQSYDPCCDQPESSPSPCAQSCPPQSGGYRSPCEGMCAQQYNQDMCPEEDDDGCQSEGSGDECPDDCMDQPDCQEPEEDECQPQECEPSCQQWPQPQPRNMNSRMKSYCPGGSDNKKNARIYTSTPKKQSFAPPCDSSAQNYGYGNDCDDSFNNYYGSQTQSCMPMEDSYNAGYQNCSSPPVSNNQMCYPPPESPRNNCRPSDKKRRGPSCSPGCPPSMNDDMYNQSCNPYGGY